MRRVPAILIAIAVVAIGVAWSVSRTDHGGGCSRSRLLVPACGVMWGIVTAPHSIAAVDAAERATDSHFDLVYRFHYLDEQLPTADERQVVRSGRALHIAIASALRGQGRDVTWAEVASGAFDPNLTAQARGIASLGEPVFVTFEHEQDRDDRRDKGSAAAFVAAWRHVHDVFARAGATRVVWVWVVTGYPPFFAQAAATWPGNSYVDWISWEGYNGSGCAQNRTSMSRFTSFADDVLPFYNWLTRHGAANGIDASKPMMISEAGSVVYPSAPQLTADWYRGIPGVLADHPGIKAISLWDRPGNAACDYRFDDVPAIRAAVGEAGALVKLRTGPF